MRPFLFFILFTFYYSIGLSQNNGAVSNSLGGCGLTQTNVWSNFSNQAGLAEVNQFTLGISSEKQFLLSELNQHSVAVVFPVNGGTIGLNLNYFGFDLYNETKLGLAFGKKLSKNFNIGLQLNYLGTHVQESSNSLHNFTFEIGLQKQLNKDLTLGVHIFNPTITKLNKDENIPSLFKLGLAYNINQKVNLFTETSLETEQDANLHLGLEYRIISELSLRTGFSTNPSKNSFGIGYTLNKIQIDIAVNKHQTLGYSPQLSISKIF